MSETITVNGQSYEITNWEDFKRQVMFLLGETTVNAIQDEAMRQGLFETGSYVRGWKYEVRSDGVLVISNDDPKAAYLEYGTYEFGYAFSDDTFPGQPFPKKKNMSGKEASGYPRGMQPFAPARRVLYNDARMRTIVNDAFGGGTPQGNVFSAIGSQVRKTKRFIKQVQDPVGMLRHTAWNGAMKGARKIDKAVKKARKATGQGGVRGGVQ